MNRKTLGVLAIAILVAMVAILFVGDGGLSKKVELLAKTELASFQQAQRTVESMSTEVRGALESQPEFFAAGGYDEAWRAALAKADEWVATGETTAGELNSLLEQNDKSMEDAARGAVENLSSVRVAALAAIEPSATEARRLLSFKENLPQQISAMETDHASIASVDLGGVQAKVAQASADWPEKAADLRARLRTITEIPESVEASWIATKASRENAENLAPEALIALAREAQSLSRSRAALEGAPAKLEALIAQLDRSWDKILVDMEINEGLDVTFRHKYRKVYSPVLPEQSGMLDGVATLHIAVAGFLQGGATPEASPDGLEIEESWATVSKAEFERMKKNLGMVVAHKPAGKYDHEAESLVQPAGFQYVAPYGQRNRYGYWDGGFWRFYGQYAFMRDMFWGRGWRVGRDDWDGYRRHRDTGQTYYGSGRGESRYGSSGASTRSRYASSGYVKTDGYKNSNYMRSGGTYKGSRYASRSSRSSSGGSRSGGFSRSGGRSGGK